MKPIIYSEYKDILDITKRGNVEDSYQDLMSKEEQVLTTVNNVVKYYREEDIKDGEFINQSLSTIVSRFFDIWKDIIDDVFMSNKTKKPLLSILTQEDRPIYLGITTVIIAVFLIFIESSKW